ncbi:MmpS family transport accessory protein [Mycolicibacterium phocaicum]|uniref:MmpS family transport accessory protein n=1 Tax=Mycolicibacterium phocaicum TaxID=319706 RepID=UPI003B84A485
MHRPRRRRTQRHPNLHGRPRPGDSITCTVHVDDELKDTRTSTGVHAQTFCLVKSA